MKTTTFLLILLTLCSIGYSQNVPIEYDTILQHEWTKTYSSQDSIYNGATAIDYNGNVYVTGFTYNQNSGSDITTIKYSSTGNQLWVKNYNGPGNKTDRATCITYNSAGEIYVCGYATNVNNNLDIVLIKYSQNGTELWSKLYDNGGSDTPYDIELDANGNIYITGESRGTLNQDIITLKYKPDGNLIWQKRKDNGNHDSGRSLEIYSNTVFVAGQSRLADYDYYIIKYDLNGNELLTTNLGVAAGSSETPQDMVVTGSGIYITGYTNLNNISNILTVKYDLNLVNLWTIQEDNGINSSYAYSICNDENGNIYVAGLTKISSTCAATTIKYDASGNKQWGNNYYVNGNIEKYFQRITCDNNGHVYVCSPAFRNNFMDYLTIKYDYDGNEKWYEYYSGVAHGQDVPTDLTVDANGNIYVTGQGYNGNNYDFVTVKYSAQTMMIPPDNQYETPSGLYTYRQNKGQLKRTDNTPADEVKYYCTSSFPHYYITGPGFSYVIPKTSEADTMLPDSAVRVDFIVPKAINTKTYGYEPVASKLNYFLEHIPEGRTNINGYQRIVVPNIHNKINLHYYSNEGGFKFYYVVSQGGSKSDISFKFNGADHVSVSSTGGLLIETRFGNIEYEKAWVGRINPAGNIVPMPTSGTFNIGANGDITVDVGNYPANNTLIVAVTEAHAMAQQTSQTGNLNWSTYHTDLNLSGSADMGFAVCNDKVGNTYTVGQTDRPNFPTNDGYYYDPFGDFDAYLSRFTLSAVHLFTTFYGGSGEDNAFAVAFNQVLDRVYFTGRIYSDDIPIWPSGNVGSYNQSTGFGNPESPFSTDAYIAQFSAFDGEPIWTSYFSGNSNDAGRSIACDDAGNVYLAGNTSTNVIGQNSQYGPSDGGFPIFNAYDNTHNGNQDIFYAKFNKNDNLIYSTWFGGDNTDNAFDIEITSATVDIAYFGGSTASNNYPCISDGSSFYTTQFVTNEGTSAFISSFALSTGVPTWSTYFPRVKEFQSLTSQFGVKRLYAVGLTTESATVNTCDASTSGLPICNYNGISTVQSSNGGYYDIFIAKFEDNRLHWSSFYGGSEDEWSDYYEISWNLDRYISSTIDDQGTFYVTGLTNKLSTGYEFPCIEHQDLYYDDYNDGMPEFANDMFILGYNPNNQLFWSTLFGGGDDENQINIYSNDLVGGISAYKHEYLNLTGWTHNKDYPVADPGTPNAYYHPTLNFPNYMPVSTVSRFAIIEGVGIEEHREANNLGISVYPVPANETLFINSENDILSVQVFDNLGQLCISGYRNKVDISQLNAGIYLISVETAQGIANLKFIKQ